MKNVYKRIIVLFALSLVLSSIGKGTEWVYTNKHHVCAKDKADKNDDYGVLRSKWITHLNGEEPYDSEDPDISANIEDLVEKVTNSDDKGYWDTMEQSSDRSYLWSDIKSTTDSADITSAYDRLLDMARTYTIEDSSLYHNEQLKEDIIDGLDWMYNNRYNNEKEEYDNWWDWEIGSPKDLNSIAILMYDELSSEQIDHYMESVHHFVPDPTERKASGVTETGANRLDKALIVTLYGAIQEEGEKIEQGRDALSQVFLYVKDGDGMYKDGSFIQHEDIAYTGGYGEVLIGDIADMFYLLKDSPWDLDDPNSENVYQWVGDAFEPLIYKGAMMDMVSGRGVTRQDSSDHTKGRSVVISLLELSQGAPSKDAEKMKRMVKYWIQQDRTFDNYTEELSIYDVTLVKSLMNDSEVQPREEFNKNHVFPSMDRVVHHRPDFSYGISMFSDRISAFEYGNGENKKGWYTGLGMTYLYNNDLTQFSDGYWPTVDMVRLPGTTTDHSKGDLKDWDSYLNTNTWVGGTSIDDRYGTAGMEFSQKNVTGSPLKGKKSWFMFDDETVALGSGITDTNDQEVETIVENRKLNHDGDNELTVNGKKKSSKPKWSETMDHVQWAHLEGNVSDSDIGYYFPNDSKLDGLREERTGSWQEVNDGGSSDSLTRDYLSLAFNHGEKPENSTYEYVLLPKKDASETKEYSKDPDIEVLNNTEHTHAVKEKTLGITAANFFEPDKTSYIASDSPASVIAREEGDVLTLSVTDPTQEQDTVTIDLDKSGEQVIDKDDAIDVVQTQPTIKVKADVADSLGKTHSIQLIKDDIDTSQMLDTLKEYRNGIFSDEAYHKLKTHLKAVNHFEEEGKTEKVIEHMKAFKQLLMYQEENDLISEDANHALKINADAMIK